MLYLCAPVSKDWTIAVTVPKASVFQPRPHTRLGCILHRRDHDASRPRCGVLTATPLSTVAVAARLSFDFTIPHTGLFVNVSPWNNQSWSPFFFELDRATLQFKTSLEECARVAKHASLLAFGRLRHHVRGIGSMRNIKRVEGGPISSYPQRCFPNRVEPAKPLFQTRGLKKSVISPGPSPLCVHNDPIVYLDIEYLIRTCYDDRSVAASSPFSKEFSCCNRSKNGIAGRNDWHANATTSKHRKGNATLRVDGVRIRRFATSPSSTILLENVKASTAKERRALRGESFMRSKKYYIRRIIGSILSQFPAGNQNVPQKREKHVFRKEEQACEMCSPSRETPCSFYGNESVRYWHPPAIQAGQDHGVLAYAPPLADREGDRQADDVLLLQFLGYGE
ncbi:hypothetical protein DFP72DRAFT_1041990 [Ephemerocybe angulata]|uniref:Uncharacterized protein n=1 Tax=Ephemerocybe angulata TaxID=980116 RepID=A0A8H6MB42_9AGAR|nr:hypothetical protein DFP72DRAFT_1041990 [Tulosesus angulatus]